MGHATTLGIAGDFATNATKGDGVGVFMLHGIRANGGGMKSEHKPKIPLDKGKLNAPFFARLVEAFPVLARGGVCFDTNS